MNGKHLPANGRSLMTTLKVLLLVTGIWGGLFPGLLWALGQAVNA